MKTTNSYRYTIHSLLSFLFVLGTSLDWFQLMCTYSHISIWIAVRLQTLLLQGNTPVELIDLSVLDSHISRSHWVATFTDGSLTGTWEYIEMYIGHLRYFAITSKEIQRHPIAGPREKVWGELCEFPIRPQCHHCFFGDVCTIKLGCAAIYRGFNLVVLWIRNGYACYTWAWLGLCATTK